MQVQIGKPLSGVNPGTHKRDNGHLHGVKNPGALYRQTKYQPLDYAPTAQ